MRNMLYKSKWLKTLGTFNLIEGKTPGVFDKYLQIVKGLLSEKGLDLRDFR